MSTHYVIEKRDFVRVQTDIPVRYKFLSRSVPIESEGIFEGTTSNLSGSGLLLVGKIPGMSWIPGLLMGEILIGVNLLLPSVDVPIKALTRVAWIEAFEKGSEKCGMGLRFREISKENQDEILKYIIKAQITR
ncbi:MAG: PilZ domain-containing protein [Planctomycetes bacterium]|nr:PilZ domain-containing protein [Planctomycetota bacterium]